MTFEKEMERLSKLTKSGDVALQKHWDKMSEITSRYAATHDMEINNARKQYDWMFNFYCRQAEEMNMDLWVYLSTVFMIQDERHFIKPPAKFNNKKIDRELWLKEEFRQYYYECIINDFMAAFANELSELKKLNSVGGKLHGKQETQGRIVRREPVIQKRKKLIDSGVKDDKEIMRRVIKAFPKRSYNFIQKTILAEKYKEADDRKNQHLAL